MGSGCVGICCWMWQCDNCIAGSSDKNEEWLPSAQIIILHSTCPGTYHIYNVSLISYTDKVSPKTTNTKPLHLSHQTRRPIRSSQHPHHVTPGQPTNTQSNPISQSCQSSHVSLASCPSTCMWNKSSCNEVLVFPFEEGRKSAFYIACSKTHSFWMTK